MVMGSWTFQQPFVIPKLIANVSLCVIFYLIPFFYFGESFTYIPDSTLKHPCELNYKNYHKTYFIRIKNLAHASYLEES